MRVPAVLVSLTIAALMLARAIMPAHAVELGEVTIETSEGRVHVFQVEIVSTPEEMALGLMFRQELAADAGMLFVYEEARETSFWMQNTFLPLDMLFINADGTIRHIAERTVPLSTASVPSHGPVRAVLEINGGTSERLGINVGDHVRW